MVLYWKILGGISKRPALRSDKIGTKRLLTYNRSFSYNPRITV
jgi:hypothetical protein